MITIEELIKTFELKAHPEGGYFKMVGATEKGTKKQIIAGTGTTP